MHKENIKSKLDIIKLFGNMPNDLDYNYKSMRNLKKNRMLLNRTDSEKETTKP